ncbi:MAG: hypothetical protein ACON4U_04235 [Myxococcota bacterium]
MPKYITNTGMAFVLFGTTFCLTSHAKPNVVTVQKDENGHQILIDGEATMLLGMNWGYIPIGQNYSYDFWGQPEDFIQTALDREMSLLRDMGVNTVRQYAVIPPKWVTYIYQKYGITTMINHTAGRYGLEIDGTWVPVTNYQDPKTRALIKSQFRTVVQTYKDTEGVVLWLIGNENNYGLHWDSFEIAALPKDEAAAARASYLYSLYGEIVDEIHAADPNHPVAIANGDLQYIDLIATHIPNLDILGSNVYRGESARDFFQKIDDKLGIPALFTEFGADAYNAKLGREDHLSQAYYLQQQWKEIYLQSHGKGLVGNAIGGYTFQWSDGWWKYRQEENLDIHDPNASWPNGGYPIDYVEGQFNMNEEWFGICAKGFPDDFGHFELYPRAAYYLLKDAYTLDPYTEGLTQAQIMAHFDALSPYNYDRIYKSHLAVAKAEENAKGNIADLRIEMTTIASGNSLQGNPGFDHMESFYVDFLAQPTDAMRAEVSFNILGHVPENRIDRLFYEARGERYQTVDIDGEEVTIADPNRLAVYRSNFTYEHALFNLTGYFREGHFHWASEGDFFNFYREAYYGPNPDIYNANVPIGIEVEGKGKLSSFKMAAGPQIYWGANPTAILKYYKPVGRWNIGALHQEDFAAQDTITTLNAVPEQLLRRSSVYATRASGPFTFEVGGLLSGLNKVGRSFEYTQDSQSSGYADSGKDLLTDEIYWFDALGGKSRIVGMHGPFMWYAQGGYQGLVADGGPEQDQRFTGWTLRNSGRGNHWHTASGFALNVKSVQIAPNVLVQKPLVGPLDPTQAKLDGVHYQPAIQPRNIFDDPFLVLDNREMVGAEILLVYDPTPATWMWYWDNDIKEDAPFSASLDVSYQKFTTTTDANIGFNEYGVFVFPSAPPPADIWTATSRIILTNEGGSRMIANLYGGNAQSTGSDSRMIQRYGGQLRMWHKKAYADLQVKVNDWGPFDYHRAFNLTFPLQLIGDFSYAMRKPRFGEFFPRIGTYAKYRSLDKYSEPLIPLTITEQGFEYEVGTYVHFGL